MEQSKMTQPLIQMALDSLNFYDALRLAEQVAPHVDIFEVGTPCLKYNGIQIVKALKKRFTQHKILVDLKTMDAGEYEAAPFYAAGANVCTVLGVAGSATIAGVISAANGYGGEVQVDLMNVVDKLACATEAVELGARIIGVHSGLDAQAASETPFADLQAVAGLGLRAKISVAGGINAQTASQAVEFGASIIVAGPAIYGAASPVEAAATIRNSVLSVAV